MQEPCHYTWIEMFAGKAEATRVMRYGGHHAAKLDLKYHEALPGKQNYMDILTPAGFAYLFCNVVLYRGPNMPACVCSYMQNHHIMYIIYRRLYI